MCETSFVSIFCFVSVTTPLFCDDQTYLQLHCQESEYPIVQTNMAISQLI